jgi:hypothetical protein
VEVEVEEEAAGSITTAVVVVVDAISVDADPSATIARTTVATALQMIREDKEVRVAKVFRENMARAPMNLPSLFPDLQGPRLMTDLHPSLLTPRGSSKSPARDLASSARRSAPTPPLRTTSSSPLR